MLSTVRIAVMTLALATAGCYLVEAPEAAIVQSLKTKAVGRLKDPESAKMQGVTYFTALAASSPPVTRYTICGDINAKNSFGGYIGFRAFYVTQFCERARVQGRCCDLHGRRLRFGG